MRTIHALDATAPDVVVGRHSIWSPAMGIKVPFQWGGRITKYRHAEPNYDVAETLPHELAILRALAAEGMAPPVGDLVFVENLVSEHPGGWHCDPCGAIGYEVADARALPPGRFSIERMRQLPIFGSPGAWGDIGKPGNVVNGYLVDVRRSAWDMLQWTGTALPDVPRVQEDGAAVAADVHRLCQFPAGERAEAYQDFYLGRRWHRGQRRVVERDDLLGFNAAPGEACSTWGASRAASCSSPPCAGAQRVSASRSTQGYVDCAPRPRAEPGRTSASASSTRSPVAPSFWRGFSPTHRPASTTSFCARWRNTSATVRSCSTWSTLSARVARTSRPTPSPRIPASDRSRAGR
jgi:hypothetical protein